MEMEKDFVRFCFVCISKSSGTELAERGDLSREKAKDLATWRLGSGLYPWPRSRSLSSLDINTYFSPLAADGPSASPFRDPFLVIRLLGPLRP